MSHELTVSANIASTSTMFLLDPYNFHFKNKLGSGQLRFVFKINWISC